MQHPTSEERYAEAASARPQFDVNALIPQDERLPAPQTVTYGAGLIKTATLLAGITMIGAGVGIGIQDSHESGRAHVAAIEAYNHGDKQTSDIKTAEYHQAAAAADTAKSIGWAAGLSTITLGLFIGGRLRKAASRENDRRKADYATAVQKHVGQKLGKQT